MLTIDINCDLGEGIGNEAALMPLISSCNIACGGHAGNKSTMEAVVSLAQNYNVKIGAHPSFPDREHFGRKIMKLSSEDLHHTLYQQTYKLKTILDSRHLPLHHVKPHGALYNLSVTDSEIASVVVDVIMRFGPGIKLYTPYDSVISKIAIDKGLEVKYEAFIDRNYNDDLNLISRRHNNALIHDPEAMFEHVKRMIFDGNVKTINGVEVPMKAETFCVHGDHNNVVNNLKHIITKLKQVNVEISSSV